MNIKKYKAVISGLMCFVGGAALLLTMSLVALNVLGRHLSIPLPGTIEIVELLVLVAATMGIVFATTEKSHASAKLFVEHLSPLAKSRIERIGLLFGFIFCGALVIGNIWILSDVWSMDEESHLLHIDIIPFRIFFILSMIIVCIILLRRLVKKNPEVAHES